MKTLTLHIFTLLLAGCGYLPDIRLSRSVAPSEIIGVWTMTKDSFLDIKSDHNASGVGGPHSEFRIEIRADGTLRYRSLLQMPTRVVDCQGTWQLRPRADSPTGNSLYVLLNANGRHAISLDFTEEEGRLILWKFLGDPDNWQLEKYQKLPQENTQATPPHAWPGF